MLCLSRKVGEVVVIGDGVRVRIEAIKGNTVKLSFDAPESVRILRGELTREERDSERD